MTRVQFYYLARYEIVSVGTYCTCKVIYAKLAALAVSAPYIIIALCHGYYALGITQMF